MTYTYAFLKQKQSLPLSSKMVLSKQRIREFYEKLDGQVFVAFSGGKDSTVLLHFVRSIYPDVKAVFCDTGLEYPEIRDFVKTIDNVDIIKPEMAFKKVLDTYGYPVVSKRIARELRDLQHPTTKNEATRHLYLTGEKRDKTMSSVFKIPEKWTYLVDAPFMFSEKCCDIMKKKPMNRYCREKKQYPYVGTMACDSNQRQTAYLRTGCNSFSKENNQERKWSEQTMSRPLSFWLRTDIDAYIKKKSIACSEIYEMGETHTGCMFCMFGVHLEKCPNRFQRMSKTHPKQYKYCMETLKIKDILTLLKVPYGDEK